jgi:DNA-binding transcriptional LysR family regulator
MAIGREPRAVIRTHRVVTFKEPFRQRRPAMQAAILERDGCAGLRAVQYHRNVEQPAADRLALNSAEVAATHQQFSGQLRVPADERPGLTSAINLELGLIDLGFVALNVLKWRGIASAIACKDRLVAVVDVNHPLACQAHVTSDDFARYPAIDWVPSLDLSNRATIARVSKPAARADPILVSQHETTLPIIIQGTDIVATVPRAFARRMSRLLPLKIIDLPVNSFDIETRALWSKLQDADPSHAWFRETASQVLALAHLDES